MSCSSSIIVGARSSPLSQVQVKEVLEELKRHHPDVEFTVKYTSTVGDRDLNTSLRTLGKTDFFTKEIDQMLLQGECRIGIHSAKDLPDPLPKGLKLICLTNGVDSSDSLVMREGETIESLPDGAIIATSSVRREELVSRLRMNLTFKDIRGTIGQRLSILERGEADGVVVAEAALIRLGLSHLNRVRLPGETVVGQGQLAVVAREGDTEMIDLFSPMNVGNL